MFTIFDRNIADVEPFVTLAKKTGEFYTIGQALKLTADGAAKCGPTDMPQYICVGLGEQLTAIPVLPTTQFEVGYTAVPAVGAKVTLHTDSEQVTATATNGVFTVVSVDSGTGKTKGYFR